MEQTATPPTRRLSVRWADWEAEADAITALRRRAFGDTAGAPDRFDPACDHLLVEDVATGGLACAARVRLHRSAADLADSYTGQFYDLAPLASSRLPALELGRLCSPDGPQTASAGLMLVLAALARRAEAEAVRILFGCASFPGVDPARWADAARLLVEEALGPAGDRPRPKAAEVLRPTAEGPFPPDRRRRALRDRPPLLRGYLSMGGWVGDHLVVDRAFGTCHVFTALPVEAVTEARRRRLALVLGLAQEVV